MDGTQFTSSPSASRLSVARILEHHHWQKYLDDKAFTTDRIQNVARVLNLLTACRTGRMGSHLYRCGGCQRSLMGMDHCDDRHCLTCGDERRDAWRKEMISWSLDCDYFHAVFTLPHEFNPLIYINSPNMYRLLITTSKDAVLQVMKHKFGCLPGITQTLHTWGQKMNLHVHTHNILTAGGLSLDGTRWIMVDPNHPFMQPEYLAEVFRKMFITRVGHRLRRDKLIWPTRSLLPKGDCHQALGLSSHEQMLWLCGPETGSSLRDENDEPITPPASESVALEPAPEPIRKATPRKRDLTAQERVFLKQLRATTWIVDCQVTPPGYEGPKRAISYLARYVAGVAISDQRLVSDAGGIVTINYKDYRAKNGSDKSNKYKTLVLPVWEFILRFMLHILPRGMARVRHSGLFTPSGRDDRLAKCRELLQMAKQERAVPSVSINGESESIEEAEDEEPVDVPKATNCQCRYCKEDMELVGRLKGTESMWIMNVAQQIVREHVTLLPVINEGTVTELLAQVRSCWITLRFLPAPISDLLRNQRFTSLEMAALEARLWHELRLSLMAESLGLRKPKAALDVAVSGIPPPVIEQMVPST